MRYRTILVANDGQAHSRRAMWRAAELARESRAELHVVHVPEPEPNVAMLRASDYADAMRAEREAEVRSQLRELTAGDPPVTIIPHFLKDRGIHNAPAKRIAELAERIDADLIVVGSRRRSKLGAAVVGSTSQRLMRETGRPLLVLAGEPRRTHHAALA